MKKFYDTIQQVTVDPVLLKKAWDFSVKVVTTTNYSDSKQNSVAKITQDHFISKVGEEAAKTVLMKYGNVLGPDYGIYSAAQKSWDDDLKVDGAGVAVKTQKRSTALRFGLSWTFQSGPSRSDIILQKPDAWVIFVEFDDFNNSLCRVYPPFQVRNLIFGEPVLDRLKGFKKVVYASMLPK